MDDTIVGTMQYVKVIAGVSTCILVKLAHRYIAVVVTIHEEFGDAKAHGLALDLLRKRFSEVLAFDLVQVLLSPTKLML